MNGRRNALNPDRSGTKVAAHYRLVLPPGGSATMRARLVAVEHGPAADSDATVDAHFAARRAEADAFYARQGPAGCTDEERRVARQAWAGLHWCKQYYHYSVAEWLHGDPAGPPPPSGRKEGRNAAWAENLYNRDVLSMPDTWEYPWYAAWDLAFHMLPFCEVDPAFAKEQLVLLLREWYMHPNGHLPAYEWAFSDVNPPVHAWAAWRVYKKTGPRGRRDVAFLKRAFHKLLLNFTWWVNRKDPDGKNLFAGGFLGLDNVGVFDRSKPLPTGGHLTQADGTAWMAFFCTTMLSIALELAQMDDSYEDIASKFFEHFVAIVDAINALGGQGLWDEKDGFYYDHLVLDGQSIPIRLRSLVGLFPLFAAEVLGDREVDRLPGFNKRMRWFLENRPELAAHVYYRAPEQGAPGARLLAIAPRERLVRLLGYILDENEFLSPYGIRSLSRVHAAHPYQLAGYADLTVHYDPGESTSGIFGGNSNWRGPVWFPANYLLIEALERYHHFYGDSLKVECPTGSGTRMTLYQVAEAHALEAVARAVPARRVREPAGARWRAPLREGPGVPRPGPVLRVLPRRQRKGPRRQPPDRLDGAGAGGAAGRRRVAEARRLSLAARLHQLPRRSRACWSEWPSPVSISPMLAAPHSTARRSPFRSPRAVAASSNSAPSRVACAAWSRNFRRRAAAGAISSRSAAKSAP